MLAGDIEAKWDTGSPQEIVRRERSNLFYFFCSSEKPSLDFFNIGQILRSTLLIACVMYIRAPKER